MRLTSSLLKASLISLATAQVTGATQDLLKYLPNCGLTCLVENIPKSVCAATNQTCVCENAELATAMSVCVAQNCTVIESLQFKNVSSLMCGVVDEDKRGYILSVAGVAGAGFLCGILRLWTRWHYEGSFQADDYMMIVILILELPYASTGLASAGYGFGQHIWDVGTERLTMALKLFFIAEPFYITILGLTKISVIMFYMRIFPARTFQRICWGMIIWIGLSTVVFFAVTVFQCIPISYNWESWKGGGNGHCTNLSAQTYATSAVNIIQDFSVLILPIPPLVHLNVSLKKKLNIICMFSIGIFICITSIVRLTKVVQFKRTTDPTWDYTGVLYWTGVESYLSILVPNLPALRGFLAHSLPNTFGYTQNQNRNQYQQSNGDSYANKSMKLSDIKVTTTHTIFESTDPFSDSRTELNQKSTNAEAQPPS